METLRGLGSAVGEYAGDGKGESENVTQAQDLVNAEPEDGLEDDVELEDGLEDDDARPLLVFYDCESTGLSIYNDSLTDIAAKVVACPVPLHTPTFSMLVRTSRHIPSAGNYKKKRYTWYYN